jgi:hypothetical protein
MTVKKWIFILSLGWAGFLPLVAHASEKVILEETDEKPGTFVQILTYLPNRILDAMDVFRIRAKVGPGLGVGARITDYFSLYAGESHSLYVGLPGPRQDLGGRGLFGREHMRGAVVLGVDASDHLPYAPHYEKSEIGLSAHLLLVGAEVMVSPNEFVDFLAGFLGLDPSQDDLLNSKPKRNEAEPFPVLGTVMVDPYFPLQPKPDTFPGMFSRLDYLAENVPILIRSELHRLDRWLMEDPEAPLPQPPVRDLELSLYYQMVSGPDGSYDLKPGLRLDVELPNVEQEISLFLASSHDDDLPGIDSQNRNDEGWSIGFRRVYDELNLSSDIGIHSGWVPELFGRIYWDPRWSWGDLNMRFEQRLFWEFEDGFGVLSSLNSYRWLGKKKAWQIRTLTAGKFSESTEGYEWQQSFILGHLTELMDESHRSYNVGMGDALSCFGIKASVFGQDRLLSEYRTTLVYRKNLYNDFVLLEVEPGAQWRNEHDWTTQYRLDLGILFVF